MGAGAWGPHLWYSMHYIALGYPNRPSNEERTNYYTFFFNLHKVIPCKKCSRNYREHLKELPLEQYMTSGFKLFEWTVKVHNIVNKEHGKKEWTYDEAYNYYTNLLKNDDSRMIGETIGNNRDTASKSMLFNINVSVLLITCFLAAFVCYKLYQMK